MALLLRICLFCVVLWNSFSLGSFGKCQMSESGSFWLCPRFVDPASYTHCCGGTDSELYCCDPSDSGAQPVGVSAGGAIAIVAIILISCYFCRCCWWYKYRNRAHTVLVNRSEVCVTVQQGVPAQQQPIQQQQPVPTAVIEAPQPQTNVAALPYPTNPSQLPYPVNPALPTPLPAGQPMPQPEQFLPPTAFPPQPVQAVPPQPSYPMQGVPPQPSYPTHDVPPQQPGYPAQFGVNTQQPGYPSGLATAPPAPGNFDQPPPYQEKQPSVNPYFKG